MATKTATPKAGDNTVQALSPFTYTEDLGPLVRGQVFELGENPNDHLLLGMDYVRPVRKGTELLECGECGRLFLDEQARERHGRHFHDHWCDCGWTPTTPEDLIDKDRAMQQHMKTCDVWRSEREAASKRHLQVALASA